MTGLRIELGRLSRAAPAPAGSEVTWAAQREDGRRRCSTQASILNPQSQNGFTLVELVIVIAMLGILGATVAVFIGGPVRAYFDTIARAQLTDAADTTLRRLTRELQGALPNSVRVSTSGGTTFLELVPVLDAGRYRAAASSGAEVTGTDTLDVADPLDTQFQVLGRPVTVPANAQLVIYNLGFAPFDVYEGSNRRSVTTAAGTASTLAFAAADAWPAESPERRFFIVRTPVTYACTPGANGSGRLQRIEGYALSAVQPTNLNAAPLAGATRSLVLDNVSACIFSLGPVLANSNGVALTLTVGTTETTSVYAQVFLPNSP
ncbi:MAG: prepilin-type N-terminal cleavage/methylation domain-containing protein [Betaproteobacteria bacterium]